MSGMGCQVCYDSPCTCTFMVSAVACNYDDLREGFEDAVEEWHKSGATNIELYEFLGMTNGEYRSVVENPCSLEKLVEDRRRQRMPRPEPRVLGPCARPGQPGVDWWKEQHISCTGSHHLNDPVAGIVEIVCSCECGHRGHKVNVDT